MQGHRSTWFKIWKVIFPTSNSSAVFTYVWHCFAIRPSKSGAATNFLQRGFLYRFALLLPAAHNWLKLRQMSLQAKGVEIEMLIKIPCFCLQFFLKSKSEVGPFPFVFDWPLWHTQGVLIPYSVRAALISMKVDGKNACQWHTSSCDQHLPDFQDKMLWSASSPRVFRILFPSLVAWLCRWWVRRPWAHSFSPDLHPHLTPSRSAARPPMLGERDFEGRIEGTQMKWSDTWSWQRRDADDKGYFCFMGCDCLPGLRHRRWEDIPLSWVCFNLSYLFKIQFILYSFDDLNMNLPRCG